MDETLELAFFHWLYFFSTEISGGQASTLVGVLHDVFCTRWHKVANEIVRKFCHGRIMFVATWENRRHCVTFTSLFRPVLCHPKTFRLLFISSHHIFSFINISRRYTRLKKTQNNILVPSLPVRDSSVFYIRRCATPVHNNLAKEDSLLWIGEGDKDMMKKESLSVLHGL